MRGPTMSLKMGTVLFSILGTAFGLDLISSGQKQLPPEGGAPRDFKIPAGRTFILGNGLKVTLVPYGKVPKATIRFIFRTGAIDEPADRIWISSFVADFLKEGTAAKTAKEIAEAAAGMGAEISSNAGTDISSLGGTVLSEFVSEFIALLADMLRNPAFPESELVRIRANHVRRMAVAKAQPQTLAGAGFMHALYGDHPYGRLFPAEEALKSYSIAAVRKFFEDRFGARRTHLYVAGVFDEKKVEASVRAGLENWRAGAAPAVRLPSPKSKRAVYVLDRPGSVQSTVLIGLPVIHPADKDFIALQVTDALLGSSFASRITSNIREDKGYTYAPSSALQTHYRDAAWYEQADVSTEVTGAALKEIFFEIDRLGREAPPPEELKGIQANFAGLFVLQNATPGGIISQLNGVELHGLGKDYLAGYVRNVLKVAPADVQRMAKSHLRSKDMTIYIVGDLAKIRGQIAPYGEIVKTDIR
ncbi:MAG: insulinase family protein [Candidatus Aminicenantes bacterium]|nr:insulinase family protein [Candidatus Aminicenantes bacterium]